MTQMIILRIQKSSFLTILNTMNPKTTHRILIIKEIMMDTKIGKTHL
jgi:hypothetical protein